MFYSTLAIQRSWLNEYKTSGSNTQATNAVNVLLTVANLGPIVEHIQSSGGRLTFLVNNVGGGGLFGVQTFCPLAEVPMDVASMT